MYSKLGKNTGSQLELRPIDLRQLYGEYFRIQLDEAAECEPGGRNNPWYYQIPCKFGHIYPVSDKLLGFWCESGTIRGRLHREHPEIDVTNWSDDGEAIFLFTPNQMDIIAKYARPKKKRKLSEEHRQKLAKAGRDALQKHRNLTLMASKTGSESTKTTGGVTNHV